jgi:hypothetical protein
MKTTLILIFALLLAGLLFACKEKEDTPLQPFVPEPELKDGVYVASWSSFYEDSTNSDRSISTRFDLNAATPFRICLKKQEDFITLGRFINDTCSYCNSCKMFFRLEGNKYTYRLNTFLINRLAPNNFANVSLFYESTAGFPYFTDSCSCYDYIVGSEFATPIYLEYPGIDTIAVLYFTSNYEWHPVGDTFTTLTKPYIVTVPNSSSIFLGYNHELPR